MPPTDGRGFENFNGHRARLSSRKGGGRSADGREGGDELGDQPGNERGVGLLVHRVLATFDDDESGVAHLAMEVLAGRGELGPVEVTREHERRHPDIGKSVHHDTVVLQVQLGRLHRHSEASGVSSRPSRSIVRACRGRENRVRY